MVVICREHQKKGKPYLFTRDPKFTNLFLHLKRNSDQMIPCNIKRTLE